MSSRPVPTSDLKFPDNTTILGLVSKNHGAACRGEISVMATSGEEKQPSFNICNSKGMIVDLR
jgi:hypothetical protein